MASKVSSAPYLKKSQYSNPKNLTSRIQLFNFCIPPLDRFGLIIDSLKLRGDESIIDLGCGDGSLLARLQNECRHHGGLTGVDISRGMFASAKKENPSIAFFETSADSLPFEPESFDIALALFMVYHMPDFKKAFKEWNLILKKDGTLVIATFGVDDKLKQERLKKEVARLIGSKAPKQFSARFNFENAQKMLPRFFKIDSTHFIERELRLTNPQPYIDVLNSVRDFFDPRPDDKKWKRALAYAKKYVNKEIEKKGYFSDTVRIGFFICKKK